MQKINGDIFLTMLESGAHNLTNKHVEINALNVFPVPDGDTGTNMNLTFTSGLNDSKKVMTSHIGQLSKTLSRGLLMGARGNSGVILSQIFRGFAQSVEDFHEVNVQQLADAFVSGKEVAYKAVMRPVEGTILTVLRESADATYEHVLKNPEISVLEFFEFLVDEANKSLDNTPELLPVLKEVGVVDSGGKGYVTVLEGFVAALKGNPIELKDISDESHAAASDFEHDEFGYCTEFIIRLNEDSVHRYNEDKFRSKLEALGNSLVVVTDEDIVKVHVHTLTPGNALNLGQQYGEFVKLKIENMSEQHNTILDNDAHKAQATKEHSKYALVSVAAGEGVVSMFNDLRVEYIISGGQTMNPSTEDFVEVIEKIDADHIFILPNNSNIIMAAKQAQQILEDKDIHVIETKTVPQGLAACVMFNPDTDVESNLEEMLEAVANTKTGQITYAIKDTVFESIEIKENDFIGILEKDIVVTNPNRVEATKELCDKLIDDESELLTLIVGEGVEEEEVSEITDYIESSFDVEVETHVGDQPVYSFIIGVE
ncbi:DAK2 domain-containing protein [Erysipelothrix inopinata]|uniref:DAK2 domain-containing protein n=1 Tax=Erysipelothrix inopinata TaxID=225084 RepID=A0A7G9RXP2_9FIRM|nr:DAK2 domain-containing protein [Erysipelothrix inopinata]QNN60367.1 DAK2 domain-containing protein [Erysipelothrix inopinata]